MIQVRRSLNIKDKYKRNTSTIWRQNDFVKYRCKKIVCVREEFIESVVLDFDVQRGDQVVRY